MSAGDNLHLYLKTDNVNENKDFHPILFLNNKNIQVNLNDANYILAFADYQVALFGDVFYHLRDDGEIKLIDSNSSDYLTSIFSSKSLKEVVENLEGQYIGFLVDNKRKNLKIFSDRYARLDSFYSYNESDFYLATDLDFIFKHVKPEYDQKMLLHLFNVYGWYTPKGLTIYKNVKQLKVGEIITISDAGIESDIIEFMPLKIEDYKDDKLETYYKFLRESIIARANRNGKTWVSSSSGWDSTMLLAILVDAYGSNDIGMITGSAEYSTATSTVNKFELEKISSISKHYGIKPEVVGVDFNSKEAVDIWKKVLPYFKSRHIYTFTTYGAFKLSNKLFSVDDSSQTIFNGETSDSFHNLGFAQFVTFFHTNKSFTEYSDKMNCYLYGPSFFNKVLDGTYRRDKVFQIFQKMNPSVSFASKFDSREDMLRSYLFSFIYNSPRLPFSENYTNPIMSANGQRKLYSFPFNEYIPEIIQSISEENIYSWLIFLYHSFHSQGSTVNVVKHAMDYFRHKWRMPFDDLRLIDFLSKMPEKWGRGLEFNNTKYPLKWVARNKVNFPYELLQEGPHSYLYDVIEGFSLIAEITYRSEVVRFFKETLAERKYRELLSEDFFDLQYIDKLVEDYLNGKEVSGADFNNLVSIITLSIVGWY